MTKYWLGVLSIFVSTLLGVAAAEDGRPRSATVPMALDHNRMTVEIAFRRADGSALSARAWVDTGGTTVTVAESLARELGIDLPAMPAGSGPSFATRTPVPGMSLGGIPLDSAGMNLVVRSGRFAMPGVQADCVLPARCLRRLHLVFDYPARQLTVALPGVLAPRGTAVPCRVNPETGLFMVEAAIAGEKTALGVDTGSAGTWLSDKVTAAWLARHPGWPRAVGAAGSTNFFGFPFEMQGVLLSLPGMTVGPVAIGQEIAVLGLDQGIFDWYSQKSAAPVAGFLGADLIARFRLEVDFPGQMTWWQPGPNRPAPTGPNRPAPPGPNRPAPTGPPKARDLDIVGLALRPENDGSFTVAGVVSRAGRPAVPGVQPGDRLLSVDALDALNAPMGVVIDALRGRPGAQRVLVLERGGKKVTVRALVVRLP